MPFVDVIVTFIFAKNFNQKFLALQSKMKSKMQETMAVDVDSKYFT